MPLYDITCDGCGFGTEIFRPLARFAELPDCEHCAAGRMRRVITAASIVSDIEPYRAVAADIATGAAPVITSRSQHREFLQRNGYVEVGDQSLPPPRAPTAGLDSPGRDIRRAIEQVKSGGNHAA